MGYRPEGGVLGVLLVALLVMGVAWAISWIFAFFGTIARTAASVQGVSYLVLFPLTFLSNAFVPVDTLPGWLAAFVNVNPVSYLVTAARDLANTGTAGIEVLWAILGALAVVLVFAPLTVRAYMRRT
jgi:ABC-2 type transport system permease protein